MCILTVLSLNAVLWQELSRMQITSPMAGLDELSTLRSQIRRQFSNLVQGGIAKIRRVCKICLKYRKLAM